VLAIDTDTPSATKATGRMPSKRLIVVPLRFSFEILVKFEPPAQVARAQAFFGNVLYRFV
jgi:hypothetical protein